MVGFLQVKCMKIVQYVDYCEGHEVTVPLLIISSGYVFFWAREDDKNRNWTAFDSLTLDVVLVHEFPGKALSVSISLTTGVQDKIVL